MGVKIGAGGVKLMASGAGFAAPPAPIANSSIDGGGDLYVGGVGAGVGGDDFDETVVEGGFEAGNAPVFGGHAFDGAEFGGGLWEEVGDVAIDEGREGAFAFTGDDSGGEEALEGIAFDAVLGGDGFAFGDRRMVRPASEVGTAA